MILSATILHLLRVLPLYIEWNMPYNHQCYCSNEIARCQGESSSHLSKPFALSLPKFHPMYNYYYISSVYCLWNWPFTSLLLHNKLPIILSVVSAAFSCHGEIRLFTIKTLQGWNHRSVLNRALQVYEGWHDGTMYYCMTTGNSLLLHEIYHIGL